MKRKNLPLLIICSAVGLVVLTVCAAPPPRSAVQLNAQPTITAVSGGISSSPTPPIPVQETPVKFVRALQTVPIYGGPDKQYVTVGAAAQGAVLQVTGLSLDGKWWRIPCDERSQIRNQTDCWVEADPLFTAAAEGVVPAVAAPADTAVPAVAAPVATDTAAPVPTATDVPAAPAATDTAAPVPTATDAPVAPTATNAPVAPTATAAPAATAMPAPTATDVPPTPIPSPTVALPTATAVGSGIQLKRTSIGHIIVKEAVDILNAPATGAVIGSIPAGTKVEVTGYTSRDGQWYRVLCPDGTSGNCFVTADPAFTEPAVAPK